MDAERSRGGERSAENYTHKKNSKECWMKSRKEEHKIESMTICLFLHSETVCTVILSS